VKVGGEDKKEKKTGLRQEAGTVKLLGMGTERGFKQGSGQM